MESVTNTPLTMYAKVLVLITLNMRYEKVAFNRNIEKHPYLITKEIVEEAINQFNALVDISFIESEDKGIKSIKSHLKEKKHQELFNEIWNKYDEKGFDRYIKRYVHRIEISNLADLIKNKMCIDLGCGNGVFCFALLECGARFVAGVDFGERSIEYAQRYAKKNGLREKALFKHSSLYETGFEDSFFDFAIQNGVFHHLDNLEKAIKETKRILKKEGWFWYYTTGEGSISRYLWDVSVDILKDVPSYLIEEVLVAMNVSRDKIVHLTDGLSATYASISWNDITQKLSKYGFGNFKRLKGGFETDFDLNKIESDPFGKEKFGEGDLRILCQLIKK